MDLRDHIAQLEDKIDIMKARMAGSNAVPAPLAALRE